jgi:hypothetical protein
MRGIPDRTRPGQEARVRGFTQMAVAVDWARAPSLSFWGDHWHRQPSLVYLGDLRLITIRVGPGSEPGRGSGVRFQSSAPAAQAPVALVTLSRGQGHGRERGRPYCHCGPGRRAAVAPVAPLLVRARKQEPSPCQWAPAHWHTPLGPGAPARLHWHVAVAATRTSTNPAVLVRSWSVCPAADQQPP